MRPAQTSLPVSLKGHLLRSSAHTQEVCDLLTLLLLLSRSVMSNCFRPRGLKLARLLCPWDFPGKNTGVVCHFLLQGIFLTQGSNPSLLHWQVDSLPLSQQGSPE